MKLFIFLTALLFAGFRCLSNRPMRSWLSCRWKHILCGAFAGLFVSVVQIVDHVPSSPQTQNVDVPTSKVSFSESSQEKLPDAIYSEQDDYEPNVLLEAHKISPPDRVVQHPVRPRYYASELGIHEKLFVAISTSDETILSLGVALNKTSGHYLPRLSFFLNSASAPSPVYQNLSMHVIRSSDNSDHLKFMMVLKYIADNQMDNFDWFFIAKDSTYIRGVEMVEFVKHISVGHPAVIGVTDNSDDNQFCDLDAGILINQGAFRKIATELSWCIENTVENQPSKDVGKCVHRATGLSCNKGQLKKNHLSGHRLSSDIDVDKLFLEQPNLLDIVTCFPLTKPDEYYRLHLAFSRLKTTYISRQIKELQQSIVNQSPNTPAKGQDLTWPIGVNSPNIPRNRFDLIEWMYFNMTHLLRPDDFLNIHLHEGADLEEIEKTVKSGTRFLEERYRKDDLKYTKLINGYRRFDPSRGMEYLLDLEVKAKEVHLVKRVRLLRALGQMEQIPMPFVTENSRIHIVLTVTADQIPQATIFLKRFSDVHLKTEDNVFLMIITVYGPQDTGKDLPDDTFAELKVHIREFDKLYQKTLGTRLGFLAIRKPFTVAPSEMAVLDIVAKKFKKDSLIFRTTVNYVPSVEFLNRLRLTAIAGWQVYFPIPFAHFKPNIIYQTAPFPEGFDIKRQHGHYDRNAFEHAAFHLSDYLAARKNVVDEWPVINTDRDLLKEYPRPAKADRVFDLYSLFLGTDLHVFRGIEPALKCEFILLNCDKDNLDERLRQRCVKRLMESLANKQQLALFFAHLQNDSF